MTREQRRAANATYRDARRDLDRIAATVTTETPEWQAANARLGQAAQHVRPWRRT